jgi:hypothetical protein
MSDRTLARPVTQQMPSPSESPDDAPSPLLAQANAHARVAREARADTAHVTDADQELTRRHNRSGQ